jgi:hypothetical protein
MPASGFIARVIAAAVVVIGAPAAGGAQQALKIFDAHLHYNQQASSDLFGRANKIRGLCQFKLGQPEPG